MGSADCYSLPPPYKVPLALRRGGRGEVGLGGLRFIRFVSPDDINNKYINDKNQKENQLQNAVDRTSVNVGAGPVPARSAAVSGWHGARPYSGCHQHSFATDQKQKCSYADNNDINNGTEREHAPATRKTVGRSDGFSVQTDLPLDLWSLATEGTQESGCSEYKHLRCAEGGGLKS